MKYKISKKWLFERTFGIVLYLLLMLGHIWLCYPYTFDILLIFKLLITAVFPIGSYFLYKQAFLLPIDILSKPSEKVLTFLEVHTLSNEFLRRSVSIVFVFETKEKKPFFLEAPIVTTIKDFKNFRIPEKNSKLKVKYYARSKVLVHWQYFEL